MQQMQTSPPSAMEQSKMMTQSLETNQELVYHTVPLMQLPQGQAFALIDKLCEPQERFYKAFYRYWADVLHQPEPEAHESTRKEVQEYVDLLKTAHPTDPYFHSVGFLGDEGYTPVGLYGFRPLEAHSHGPKFFEIFERHAELKQKYQGNLAMAHAFSVLDGHRNRLMLRYAFVLIAQEALKKDINHIFFFMSDYKLERVYKRYGLEFPENLRFSDTKHSVGSYTINAESKVAIIETAKNFGL